MDGVYCRFSKQRFSIRYSLNNRNITNFDCPRAVFHSKETYCQEIQREGCPMRDSLVMLLKGK